MKKTMTFLMVLAIVCVANLVAEADVYVGGHYRSNGTYVQPHYRSNPDGIINNNWSTYPNVNPHTGTIGTRRSPKVSNYIYITPHSNLSRYQRSRGIYSCSE
jgi:hypothetical protein